VKRGYLLLGDGHESAVQFLVTTGVQNQNLLPERVRRGPHAINFLVRIFGIHEISDDASLRYQLTQQLQSLTGRQRAEYGNASRVATGPV
jgi:hypothetical protein